MSKEKLIRKMIDFYRGNLHDIEHFLKVHAYASLIGSWAFSGKRAEGGTP